MPEEKTTLALEAEVTDVSFNSTSIVEPIDLLKPKSELHANMLTYLINRIEMSEESMSKFYNRWTAGELRTQGYINLNDYDKKLKTMNDSGEPPEAIDVVIPYSFATQATVVTYLMHVFTGRKPIFSLGSYKDEGIKAAEQMEHVLQYNSDHTRMVRHLNQFFNDGEQYGVSILRTAWKTKKGTRTVWKEVPKFSVFGLNLGSETQKVREEITTYSGNEVVSIDPFMFFPDPRVPLIDVNTKGEFVSWRTYDGLHLLKREEDAGNLKWVNHAGNLPVSKNSTATSGMHGESSRSLAAGGEPTPGFSYTSNVRAKNYVQVDQGTFNIVPNELGIGDSTKVEKWIFTILNKRQIVQAEQLDNDHDMHPVVVAEPYATGYGFGNLGLSDYLASTQDTISWLANSRMHNVKSVLNDMIIVNPSMIEMTDLKQGGPGKHIRLKPSAYGKDVRSVITQLNINDVTTGHFNDIALYMRMGDVLAAVNENIRGQQTSGGRKTATEVRTAGEASISRLAAQSIKYSSTAIVDLTEQMTLNLQQYLEDDFYIDIVGVDGVKNSHRIKPQHLTGDFNYPISNGTLPMDKVAMLDVWKEIFIGVAGDQELRTKYNIGKIFEYVAELGGAKNIEQFRINLQTAPDEDINNAVQQGNLIPTQTPGVEANPGNRLADTLL
jgi:hypothetical protein